MSSHKEGCAWAQPFLILALALSLLAVTPGAFAAPSWVWNVPVVPPPGGWEGEAGKSVWAALSWHETELSESGSGAGGHDVTFVRLPELDERTALTARLPLDDHTAAVMSFAAPEVDEVLIERMAGSNIPLFLAGGEDTLIDRDGRPLPNLFALDLYRDYRCLAFARYAARTLKPDFHVALAASRFTVNQEREAKLCYGFLDDAGFMPMPFWMDTSVRDAFRMVSLEIESAADGVIITFLGSMGAREMWRSFMRVRSRWRIWNCAAPDELYRSYRGMIFVDQNLFLRERGGFLELKRRLWNTRAIQVSDIVAAGRAEALAEWLTRGIAALPQPVDVLNHSALLQSLASVRDIPFGSQRLNIAPELHRPSQRQVYIAEANGQGYALVDVLDAEGLVYTPGY